MGISDNYVPVKTIGNGSTVNFSANWAVLVASFLQVFLENTTTGVQVLQTITTDYTLVFDDSGFTVTFLSAPPATEFIVINRAVSQDQGDPYKTTKGFQGDVIENSFDKLTAIAQDQQDEINRAPKLPIGSPINVTMENPIAGKGLLWNSAADGLINSDDNFNDIVLDATTQASAAAASASAAASSASAASTSASNAAAAQTAAETAQTAAELAETNAETAQTAAELAETNAETAQTAAELAETNAETAETNAAASAAAASAAQTAAETAQTAAELAETNAETAETNAAASAAAAALSAAKLQGTSTTSLLIAVASKTFTTQSDKFFTAGTWLLATSDADPTNYMHGQVTSYSGTTLTLNVTNIGGSGTLADWTITVSGTRGAIGAGFTASDIDGQTEDVVATADNFVYTKGGVLKRDTVAGMLNLMWQKGADIASASTLTLGTDGNYFDVTGTTTITLISGTANSVKLQFNAVLTLTHDAANLILPSGANIITAAGDTAEFIQYATDDWICTNYQKADGTAVVSGGGGGMWTPIVTKVAAADSSLDFVDGVGGVVFDSTYRAYKLVIDDLEAFIEGQVFRLRFSSNGGASYIVTGYNVNSQSYFVGSTTPNIVNASSADGIWITGSIPNHTPGNDTGERYQAEIIIFGSATTDQFTGVICNAVYHNLSGEAVQVYTTGSYPLVTVLDALQIIIPSVNLTTATVTLYGLNDA